MKVIFCTDGVFPEAVGGMQRHSRLLIEELATYDDIDLTVLHPHDKTLFGGTVKEIQIEGIDTNKNYLKECKSYSKRVYEHLKANPNAIIYSQGLSVWYKAEEFSGRLIVNPHGLEPFQAIGGKAKLIAIPFKKVFKQIFRKARYVVSLGGRLTSILEQIIEKEKILVLPNATKVERDALSKPMPASNEPFNALFVARFASNKGIHILMKAIETLNKKGMSNQIQFELVGKGPLYEEYTSKYNYDNVNFHGFVDDDQLESLYKNSHLFVFPTLFEGMPTVVLESMKNGLPIIVSDTGATAEQVDRTNGYLIEKNNVDQVVQALENYYQLSAEEKQKMSSNSYQKVKDNFTWKIVAQRHKELFNSLDNE